MSPVFLSNVDDYLAPSQACVNPLFSDSVGRQENGDSIVKINGTVMPRKRRRPLQGDFVPSNADGAPQSKETAKFTMADCLACSGCVTSAETVLVEQHSLSTLAEKLETYTGKRVVFTISPASSANLQRHLKVSDAVLFKRRLATLLHLKCRASLVIDGNLPLSWSLQEAAREFCHAYRHRDTQSNSTPLPSRALSSNTSLDVISGNIVEHSTRMESRLPLLSSSCPALVCLVEKTYPQLVPHLSTAESPMAMAGTVVGIEALHVAVMPCHDKKLEASRMDFVTNDKPHTDLVITTQECLQLMSQASGSDDIEGVRTYLESLEPSGFVSSLKFISGESDTVVLVGTSRQEHADTDHMEVDEKNAGSVEDDFYPFGSGGYADYVFRYACLELFGYKIPSDDLLPWKPVETRVKSSGRSSARKRDYHSISLYHSMDNSYSLSPSDEGVPVLTFATAYGFQSLQRILQPLSKELSELGYDYIEAMACPSGGCLNGGGQLRGVERETPTQTRTRVAETQQLFDAHGDVENTDIYGTTLCPSGPFGPDAQIRLHTRFHVVPPLQHTTGATAGVAVQHTQW